MDSVIADYSALYISLENLLIVFFKSNNWFLGSRENQYISQWCMPFREAQYINRYMVYMVLTFWGKSV